MKVTDIIQASAATAPNWNLGNEQSDFKKLTKLENDAKRLPKRIELRSVNFHIPKTEYKENLTTLRMVSGLQGLVVIFMLLVQAIQMDYVLRRKVTDFTNYVCSFWLCIISMAVAALFTGIVTMRRFRRTYCCISSAISFQYLALMVWFITSLQGMTIAFSNNKEVIGYERFLVGFSFCIDFSSALAARYNAKMLARVGGIEGMNKVHEFNDFYGGIIFEVGDQDEEPPASQTQTSGDDPGKYDLV